MTIYHSGGVESEYKEYEEEDYGNYEHIICW